MITRTLALVFASGVKQQIPWGLEVPWPDQIQVWGGQENKGSWPAGSGYQKRGLNFGKRDS